MEYSQPASGQWSPPAELATTKRDIREILSTRMAWLVVTAARQVESKELRKNYTIIT